MKTFADFAIETNGRVGNIKTICPQCSPGRTHHKDPCLSVNTEEGVWLCHHCAWKGGLNGSSGDFGMSRKKKAYRRPIYHPTHHNQEKLVSWFQARGISQNVVIRHKITLGRKFFPGLNQEVESIQFPYFRNGEIINVKYRALDTKNFLQEAGAEKILYGLDDIQGVDWAVIVEGELDKLACEVAGVPNVLSVPDGAPPEHSKPSDTKFEYLVNCEAELSRLPKIINAVDADGPGKTLEMELVRRLGPERCYRVQWPDGCKDANDTLLKRGAEHVRRCIDQATPWPIDGIVEPKDLIDEIFQLHEEGWKGGLTTGWNSVDQYYTVKPGQLTIVTGIPGHGKSEFLDAMAVNMADQHGWVIGVCSPENWPLQDHSAKLLEKYNGKPFGQGPTPRMDHQDLVDGIQWLQEHFIFFSPPEDAMTIEKILELARQAVARYGIHGLIIDPWNELDHSRPANLTEVEYISRCLTKVRRFARNHGVHVWFVAHPMKLKKKEDDTYPVPTPYDISGAAHWRNKADNCLTVWRNLEEPDQGVELHVQKIRFRQVGKIGVVDLAWNPINGRYGGVKGGFQGAQIDP
ncbi:toprim domain-containing protein [Nitrospira sp. MA-1]|nr:toprim domain-containing protein [Nitrospira sp. MA-1]